MHAATLQDRVIVITGAAGDLGAAMARRFLAAGARLALMDIDAALLRDRAAHEFAAQDRVFAQGLDITDADAARDALARVAEHFGAINALVNNAAVAVAKQPIGDMSPDEWRRAIDVNLTGAFLMSKFAIPHLRAAGGGVVLNIASQLGHVAAIGSGTYGAAKAGLLALTRAIAVDHAADGIRAVSLSPGALMTVRLTNRYGSESAVTAALAARYPLGRIGTAEEAAEAAHFLISDAASFITGVDLLADGGYTAV